jgi:hypothetical protein
MRGRMTIPPVLGDTTVVAGVTHLRYPVKKS